MFYAITADALVVVHFAFIVFVMLGGLLLFRWWQLVFLHLPAAVWGALVVLQGWLCPLTPLEQHFRILAGEAGYQGGFIEYYLLPVIYPAGLTRELQQVFGLSVITVNLLVYAGLYIKYRHGRFGTRGDGDNAP